jgi:hypothetical protein
MKRFTDAGRTAIDAGNLYAGLSLALTLPDICASLENPGPGKSRARYIAWSQTWAVPKFTGPNGLTFISAEDLYQLRCSLVHSGSADLDPNHGNVLERFVFFDETTGSHMNRFDGLFINGVRQPSFLQLRAALFSGDLYDAADEWDASVLGNAQVQSEKAKLLTIQSAGFVIGGGAVRFG